MKKYDDDMLQQINDDANLLEYVGQSVELKKKGDDYFGHCPLHIDKTPSFSITPSKNRYYCFSCGRAGGIIGYLIDFEGMSFDDAVEKAAALANLDLSKMCQSQTISFLKRVRNSSAKSIEKYEHPILDQSEYEKYSRGSATEWLDEGIEQWVMDLFGIRIDYSHNRIIYPVYDIDGNLINIKARTRYPNYKELRLPKYINYFTVGCMDYFQCLNITLPYIKESNEVIIFESIKSVMKAYGWGYKNCVSAEKHTLTTEQIELLVKLKADIVFAYDSDVSYRSHVGSGQEVQRNIEKLKRMTNVYIIDDRKGLLGGEDAKNSPVDCGKEIWEELYSSKRKVVI